MGGFVEAGSISTSAQAGAMFGFRLLWAGVLAAIVLDVLLEMTGRVAAVSHHTFAAAVRERFGFSVHARPWGYRARWDQVDVSNPMAPRLIGRVGDLERIDAA